MISKRLTVKQEKFCNFFIECGNASEAYRRAYSCEMMKDKQIWEEACKLMTYPKVAQRVRELQDEQKQKSDVTKEEIIRLCTTVLRGDAITDYTEDIDGRKRVRTISKTWAAERIGKMLGFDAASEINVNTLKPMSVEEAKLLIKEL